MAPPASSVTVKRKKNGLCPPFSLGESYPPVLALMPDTSEPLCMPLVPSSCYPSAGAQTEWVWVSPCMGPLRVTAWESSSSFHWLKLTIFYNQKFGGLSCWHWNPELVGLVWGSQDILPKFLSTTHGCGTSPFHISVSPTSLVVGCSFFRSVVVGLPFYLISDGN